MAEATHLLGLPVKHKPKDIKPQGTGSGLDADKVDGKHASDLGHQAKTVKGTTDISTTVKYPNFVDMAQMSITITTGANPVLILFSCGVNTNKKRAYARLLIDGSVEAGTGFGQKDSTRITNGTMAFNILKTLSSGEHTIKVQWCVDAFDNIVYCYPNSSPSLYHRQLTVIELKS